MNDILYCGRDKTYMEVVARNQFRLLLFKGQIVQSKILIKEPHRMILRYTHYMTALSLLLCPHPKNILLIGVGAGAIIHFFYHFFPETKVDGIEYSREIINIARSYFALPDSPMINIHCHDGFRFLADEHTSHNYDLILVDAFNDHGMAPSIYSFDFFKIAASRLTAEGVIVANLWSGNSKTYKKVRKAIEKNSEHSLFVPVAHRENIIAVLCRKQNPWPRLAMSKKELKELSHKYHIDFCEAAAQAMKYNMKLTDRLHSFIQ